MGDWAWVSVHLRTSNGIKMRNRSHFDDGQKLIWKRALFVKGPCYHAMEVPSSREGWTLTGNFISLLRPSHSNRLKWMAWVFFPANIVQQQPPARSSLTPQQLIAVVLLPVPIRVGREYHPHGLKTVSIMRSRASLNIPGPLTFLMILRVWSSMNSTRT